MRNAIATNNASGIAPGRWRSGLPFFPSESFSLFSTNMPGKIFYSRDLILWNTKIHVHIRRMTQRKPSNCEMTNVTCQKDYRRVVRASPTMEPDILPLQESDYRTWWVPTFETVVPSVKMSCIHPLNNYGLVSESTKGSSPQIMLATSIRPILTREQLLAGKGVDHPLCKHRKGFLDHLKPRAFIMSVSKMRHMWNTLNCLFFRFPQLCFLFLYLSLFCVRRYA